MPVIRIDLRHPSQGGVDVPAERGATQWTPTRRRHVETDGQDYVVLPATFVGPAVGEITVAATGPGWCWRVLEAVTGGDPSPRYLVVPDVEGPLDYGDLVEVDPATLEPAAEPTEAWLAALGSVADGIPGAVADYLEAHPPSAAPGAVSGAVLTADGAGGADWAAIPAVDLAPYATRAELAAAVGDVESALGVILS